MIMRNLIFCTENCLDWSHHSVVSMLFKSAADSEWGLAKAILGGRFATSFFK